MSLVRASLYTALILIATIIFQVYTPATRGYFNLGEVAIYTVAALSTPMVAGLASGVGSAIADLVTGYGIFAPGTLLIKFSEGFIVSLLMGSFRRKVSDLPGLRLISAVVGVALGAAIAGLGVVLFTGEVEFTSVPLSIAGLNVIAASLTFTLGSWFWILVGMVIAGSVVYVVVRGGGEALSHVVPVLVGGSLMVLGYFLYEYFISNPLQGIPPEEAFLEVPVNFGQVAAGLTLSSPVISFVTRAER